MKQIINGKKYDTQTAEHIYEWDNNLGESDFNHCYEDLYRKKTGEYFLYGRGGPMSRYAESNGNTSFGSKRIVPLTIEEAKYWVEDKANEIYEQLFGEVAE